MRHVTADNSIIYSILRKKYGRGFQYIDTIEGLKIREKQLISRIKKMAIPPMWQAVKISKDPDVHLLAYGIDAKGRRQYIYNEEWTRQQQQKKFKKLKTFGKALPATRQYCLSKMQEKKWTREKVLSLVILILDHCGMRIGNQQYTARNETYGLTTLRRKHLDILGEDDLQLEYIGKHSKERHVRINDEDLVQWIETCAEKPGYEIFRYKEKGRFHNIDSSDVNDFIHNLMGHNFSSKDFRTWVGTRYAVELYPYAKEVKKEKPRSKLSTLLLKEVAKELGNTKKVTQDYYVHPKIMQAIIDEKLPLIETDEESIYSFEHNAVEECILKII